MKAMFTLSSAESKRLIAKGVAQLPEVQRAMQEGYIYIAGGTTNAFIVEELTGEQIAEKATYTAGIITQGVHCATDASSRKKPVVLKNGQPIEMDMAAFLEVMSGDDVFIKGGNAIDPESNVGVMVGEPWGGTIGRAMGRIMALGAHLILPVGLEKIIPSVPAAANFAGIDEIDYTLGMPVGMIPVNYGTVVTELTALNLLADLARIIHLGSGGVGGYEGAVSLGIQGQEEIVKQTVHLIKKIKGEPAIKGIKKKCVDCRSCHFGRGE